MFPLVAPQFLNLVEGMQAGSLLQLPWPNGSMLPARLLPTDIPGNVRLQLPGFTFVAQVPPSTPMGEIWLQLIQRNMPARFRILSQSQAIETLAGMLQKTGKQSPGKTPSSATQAHTTQPSQAVQHQHEQGVPRLDTTGLPWVATEVHDSRSMMLRDRDSGQERGMVLGEVHEDGFHLQGRLDLEHLGAILFCLQGDDDARHWDLTLHTPSHDVLSELRAAMHTWTATRMKQHPGLHSEVLAGLPEDSPSCFTRAQA